MLEWIIGLGGPCDIRQLSYEFRNTKPSHTFEGSDCKGSKKYHDAKVDDYLTPFPSQITSMSEIFIRCRALSSEVITSRHFAYNCQPTKCLHFGGARPNHIAAHREQANEDESDAKQNDHEGKPPERRWFPFLNISAFLLQKHGSEQAQ